ncbi:MAG: J domain-containing protein [Chloroflexi bacterium]|nr:J domain-containing protein [Chloroflexota bacterium]
MPAEPDYYAILGVREQATLDEIRAAYRQAARQSHPDLHPRDPTALTRFKRVQEAYDVLGDPVRRAAYRRPRLAHTPPPRPAAPTSAAPTSTSPIRETVPSTTLPPELVETIVALRLLARRAQLKRRVGRLVAYLERL